MKFTKWDILNTLDSATHPNPYRNFFNPSHPQFYMSASKVHLFADDFNWAIVFEVSGYNSGGYCVETDLIYFGNCIANIEHYSPLNLEVNTYPIYLITPDELNKFIDDDELVKSIDSIKVRDQLINTSFTTKDYSDSEINILDFKTDTSRFHVAYFIRLLNLKYEKLFSASREEIYYHLPDNLPHILTLNEWHHETYLNYNGVLTGTPPSKQESYNLMADILINKSVKSFISTSKPNTNWRNWDNGKW